MVPINFEPGPTESERIVSGSKNINPVKSQKKTQKNFFRLNLKKNQTCVKVKWADESKRNESFTRAQMIYFLELFY